MNIKESLKELLPAIKALKYFCLQVRRKRCFAEKERRKILVFIKLQLRLNEEDLPPIEEWLRGLWVGDIFDPEDETYLNSLKQIPSYLMPDVKTCAYSIAGGSGRRPIDEAVIERIEVEFSV